MKISYKWIIPFWFKSSTLVMDNASTYVPERLRRKSWLCLWNRFGVTCVITCILPGIKIIKIIKHYWVLIITQNKEFACIEKIATHLEEKVVWDPESIIYFSSDFQQKFRKFVPFSNYDSFILIIQKLLCRI